MAGLTQADKDDIRGIITELVPSIVRGEISLIRKVQGSQSIMLRTLLTDVSHLKELAREQGILYEDLEHRFTTLAEAVDENLTVRNTVLDHEDRLAAAEATQSILKSTVTAHSRQLKRRPL
jgi:hypothetical protein